MKCLTPQCVVTANKVHLSSNLHQLCMQTLFCLRNNSPPLLTWILDDILMV